MTTDRKAAVLKSMVRQYTLGLTPAWGECSGALHCQDETRFSSDTSSGNIEGRAMIDRDPHDRQPHSDVHPGISVHRLERCVPLVVITHHDEMIRTAHGGR